MLIDQRIDGARVIAPNDIWRSILFMRANTTEAFQMPTRARNQIDEQGMNLLRQWIESLPSSPVLPPPEIPPRGGNSAKAVEVILKSEPHATIRYTVDGTVPTTADLLYEKPIRLTGPTILRAKAFKPGFTKSITTQEIFLVGGSIPFSASDGEKVAQPDEVNRETHEPRENFLTADYAD